MSKTILTIIFGILLLLVFIFLSIWTISSSGKKVSTTRSKRSAAAKRNLENDLFDEIDDIDESMGYWYNKEDMADADEIMKIRYQHYFNKLDECIRDLVIEMYDCGLVRTEELYSIAYGQDALTPDSVVYRISDDSGEDEANVHASLSLPPVSDEAQRKIYEKWSGYVNELLETVDIETSDDNKKAIIDGLMTYGRKNLRTLLYSPE